MAALASLLRVHTHNVDQAQKRVSELRATRHAFEAQLVEWAVRLEAERAAADRDARRSADFAHFHTLARQSAARIEEQIAEVDSEIDAALRVLNDAFLEKKKLETLAEAQRQEAKVTARRREQKQLDEMGAQRASAQTPGAFGRSS